MAAQKSRHATWTQSYHDRASLPNTSHLASYLLQLIALKKTNLCVSADVTNSKELLKVAEQVGDSICLLKTHCDHIEDFSERTARSLVEIARRKHFLIFEDRKFMDIGSTAYKQYTKGPFYISQWADITNCAIFSGPDIISTLKEGALETVAKHNSSVRTEITVGTPKEGSEEWTPPGSAGGQQQETAKPEALSTISGVPPAQNEPVASPTSDKPPPRKQSVVSITTILSQKRESISPIPPSPAIKPMGNVGEEEIPEAPFYRSVLILAQMSSANNYFTSEYTSACLQLARQNSDFVMGFIAQESLNQEEGDNFITMTPGVQLPPPGEEGKKVEGTQGQQYNSPGLVVGERGVDVVIVGRGVLSANDRKQEAERYRKEAWKAYEERIAGV